MAASSLSYAGAPQPRRISLRQWLGDPGSASRWETGFLFLVAGLTSTIRLKVAGIQYMELLYMLQIGILLLRFRRMGLRVTVMRSLGSLALMYGVFLVGALVLSLAALRYHFYFFGGEPPFIRRPFWITISRSVELIGNSTMLIYLAESFRRSRAKLRFAMRIYFWVGMASVGFSLISFPIYWLTHIEFGVTNVYGLRIRGFMNEGGPYGLYLLSVILVGRALYMTGWEPRRRIYACFLLVVWTLAGAQSKAGGAAMIFLVLVNAVLAGSARQRLALAAATVLLLVIAVRIVNIDTFVRTYRQQAAQYERGSLFHRGDANYVEGRVGGAFIVPRMIAAHPLTGIGWGNYGYLRNNPEYRGASAWSEFADDPGLGIYGTTAEFGIPLQLLMLAALLLPTFLLRGRKVPGYILNLALLQPVAHLFGAQLNLTYVWVVTAFALGLAFVEKTEVVGKSHGRAVADSAGPQALVIA